MNAHQRRKRIREAARHGVTAIRAASHANALSLNGWAPAINGARVNSFDPWHPWFWGKFSALKVGIKYAVNGWGTR